MKCGQVGGKTPELWAVAVLCGQALHWGEGSRDLHTFIQDCAEAMVALPHLLIWRSGVGVDAWHDCWKVPQVDIHHSWIVCEPLDRALLLFPVFLLSGC